MRTRFRSVIWLPMLLSLSLACAALPRWAGAGRTEPTRLPPATPTARPAQPLAAVTTSQEQALIDLYRRAGPAVVNITVYAADRAGGPLSGAAQGSGFVYDAAGHVVTNYHVVAGARRVDVTFADGWTLEARLLGVDADSDLAVLEVDALPPGVQPLPLGDLSALQVGQTVAAIGNPFGLEGSLTVGIVSAVGRVIPSGLSLYSIPQVIQTDAAINPGNSGGPLLTLSGEVIGINTQIETADGVRSNSGVGFAVPANIVARVVPVLIAEGAYAWPWLGVRGGPVTAALAEANSLKEARGAYIAEVMPRSAAEAAGLRGAGREVEIDGLPVPVGGDVVLAVDGTAIRSFDDLLEYIALRAEVGQAIQLTVWRAGRERTLSVTLGTRPRTEEVNP